MRVVKLKKKCMIRGCNNTESFAISNSASEIGNVWICAGCLAQALSGVDESRKDYDEKQQAKKVIAEKPLFYHPELVRKQMEEAAKTEEAHAEEAEELVVNDAAEEAEEGSEKHMCVECGKEFDTLKGLKAHSKVHVKE